MGLKTPSFKAPQRWAKEKRVPLGRSRGGGENMFLDTFHPVVELVIAHLTKRRTIGTVSALKKSVYLRF